MTDQFDVELRERLWRVAKAVPVTPQPLRGAVAAAPVHAGSTTRRLAFGSLVPILAVALVGTLLAGFAGVGPFASPGATNPSSEIVATTRSGDFELTIRSASARYFAGEPIDISATLTYLGSVDPIEIWFAPAADRGPIGFGVAEPVMDGLLLSGSSRRLSCVQSELAPLESQTVPFAKSGGFSGHPEYVTFMRDPTLRLSTGVWHPYALAQFSPNDCGAPGFDIRAEIEIEVVPAPADASIPPTPSVDGGVVASTTDGAFELAIRSAKGTYVPGEPINISAELQFNGPEPSIGIGHAAGAHGTALNFGIVEPVLDDLRIANGWDLSCTPSTLASGVPLAVPFQKGGSWSSSHPSAGAFRDYLADPILRLRPGTWHVYAVAEFRVGGCPSGRGTEPIEMRVDITIVVADEPGVDPTSPPADSEWSRTPVQLDGSVRSTGSDGTFEVRLRAESETPFTANMPIDLLTAYVYLGPAPGVVVGHHSPEIGFSIEQFGVPITINREMVYDSMCAERELTLGSPASVGLTWANLMGVTAGSLPGNFDAGLSGGYLLLPGGQWRITAHLLTDVGGCPADGVGSHMVLASIDIEVRSSTPRAVQLETAGAPAEACEVPLHVGTLALDDETGLGIITDGERHPVRWPYGYTAWHDGDDVVLHDNSGALVARAGQSITYGGHTFEGQLIVLCSDVRGIVLLPGLDPGDIEIELRTVRTANLPDGTKICMTAIGGGILTRNPRTGLGFAGSGDDVVDVAWPEGYTAWLEGGVATLRDPEGRLVAREGDRVTAGGGLRADGSWFACSSIGVISN